MMRPQVPRSRYSPGLLVACTALVVAGLSAPPAAHALEGETYWENDVTVQSFARDSGDCTRTGAPDDQEAEVLPGVTDEHVVDSVVSVQHTEDEADTHTLHLEGKSSIRQNNDGEALKRLWLRSEGAISGGAALGDATDCQTYLSQETGLDGYADLAEAGFIELTVHTTGDANVEFSFSQPATGQGAFVRSGSSIVAARDSTGGARTFVDASTIYFYGYTQLATEFPARSKSVVVRRAADDDLLASGTAYAELSFVAAGSAVSGAKGSGKKYVSLGQRSCGNDKVTTTLKKKVKKAKKVTYYVDGEKVKTIGKPKKGKTVKVTLPAVSDASVKVVVKPKKGMNAKVTRSYIACTG